MVYHFNFDMDRLVLFSDLLMLTSCVSFKPSSMCAIFMMYLYYICKLQNVLRYSRNDQILSISNVVILCLNENQIRISKTSFLLPMYQNFVGLCWLSRTFNKLHHVLYITVCHLGKYANVVLLENEKAIQNALQIFPLIQRIFQHLRGRKYIDNKICQGKL